MAAVGITRFTITDTLQGAGSWRFIEARKRWNAAADLYRRIFAQLNCPLNDGYNEVQCSKLTFMAGYDYALGIDVVLSFANGSEATLQEKFLFTSYRTVTVEYMQDPASNEGGDWFNMKTQYYFVGYDRTKANSFQEWMLLDWPVTQRATMQGRIIWHDQINQQDGARASFKYAYFTDIPKECVVAGQILPPTRHQVSAPVVTTKVIAPVPAQLPLF